MWKMLTYLANELYKCSLCFISSFVMLRCLTWNLRELIFSSTWTNTGYTTLHKSFPLSWLKFLWLNKRYRLTIPKPIEVKAFYHFKCICVLVLHLGYQLTKDKDFIFWEFAQYIAWHIGYSYIVIEICSQPKFPNLSFSRTSFLVLVCLCSMYCPANCSLFSIPLTFQIIQIKMKNFPGIYDGPT